MVSKVAKFSRKNQNVTLHLGTDGCHSKGFSGGIYVVCYITSRDGGVTQVDFRWYRCRRDPEQILGVFFDLFGIYIEKYIHCFSQVIWKK